jgi:hypothetical protein
VENKKIEQISKGMLLGALIRYRESAKVAGRYKMSEWANIALARVAASSHVTEDVLLQNAIAIYHNNSSDGKREFAVELLREFRSALRDDELEALLEATVETTGV